MKRREFIKLSTLFISVFGLSGCSKNSNNLINKTLYKTIIVGAGIAGLTAAKELKDKGHDVIVLEGGQRVGGRIYTSTKWDECEN